MSDLRGLRILSEGTEEDLLLYEGCMNNIALYENARSQAHEIKNSEDAKKAKELLTDAKKLVKKDPKEAKKKVTEAKKLLEKLIEQSKKITDDTSNEYMSNLIPTYAGLLGTILLKSSPWLSVGVGVGSIVYDIIFLGNIAKYSDAVDKKLVPAQLPENKGTGNIGYERGKTVYYFNNMIKTCDVINKQLDQNIKD